MTRPALTLIELLAATVILSVVAVAGVRVARSASASVRSVESTAIALDVLGRWRQAGESWGFETNGSDGAVWRVRATHTNGTVGHAELFPKPRWRRIDVLRIDPLSGEVTLALSQSDLVEAEVEP